MRKRTWEALEKPDTTHSLGEIGLFRGKMITLCGRLTQVPLSAHGALTEEDFEVVRFIENNTPFTMLLGKTWIEKDCIRRKEEEALEQQKQELKYFMTKRIAQLIAEQENRSKLLRTRNLDHEVERTQEYLQTSRAPTPDREELLLSNPMKESQQCEAAMPKEDKNQNGKRNAETKITRKKARKLSKKRAKIEKLPKGPEGTSRKEYLQNWNSSRYQNSAPWHFAMAKRYDRWKHYNRWTSIPG
jgi:hypothetical protein